MQRCMYVLFSRQNTKIGCFIRVFLRNSRYSHVALSLDEKLYTVYSFSRKRHDSPFSGGFVREYPVHYIINAMDVPIKLCRVDMTEEEYAAARARLNDAIERSESMIYNISMVMPSYYEIGSNLTFSRNRTHLTTVNPLFTRTFF